MSWYSTSNPFPHFFPLRQLVRVLQKQESICSIAFGEPPLHISKTITWFSWFLEKIFITDKATAPRSIRCFLDEVRSKRGKGILEIFGDELMKILCYMTSMWKRFNFTLPYNNALLGYQKTLFADFLRLCNLYNQWMGDPNLQFREQLVIVNTMKETSSF